MGLDIMTFQSYGIRSNKSQYSRIHGRIVIDVTVDMSSSILKKRKFGEPVISVKTAPPPSTNHFSPAQVTNQTPIFIPGQTSISHFSDCDTISDWFTRFLNKCLVAVGIKSSIVPLPVTNFPPTATRRPTDGRANVSPAGSLRPGCSLSGQVNAS